MTQQIINIGTVAEDHTGDGLRTGGDKINENFTELYALPKMLQSDSSGIIPITSMGGASTYAYLGYDDTDSRMWVRDDTGGILRQSTDNGATFSTNKTFPAGVTTAGGCTRMLRFGAYIYMLAKDTGDNIWKIYRATPQPGNTAFSWSAALHSMTDANSTSLWTSFSFDATYMYLSEYGDPTGGPRAWRSSDGTTWPLIYGADATLRHIHAIAPDPYNAGHVWMTTGDGAAKTIQKSTDYGSNWSIIIATSAWQAVQISFSQKWVWLAGDSQRAAVIVIDRATGTPYNAARNTFRNIAVPAGAAVTDRFYANAWYGAVDPINDVFYSSANDTSVAGSNTPGLFYLPEVGSSLELLDKMTAAGGPVEVKNGVVFCHKYKRAAITMAFVANIGGA
jgi:Bacteriophage T4 gp9/10-like protein